MDESLYQKHIDTNYGITPSFPRYGNSPFSNSKILPKHGLVREMKWEVVCASIAENQCDPRPTLVLRLQDTIKSRDTWPFRFELEFKISLGLNLTFNRPKKETHKLSFWKKRIIEVSKNVKSKLNAIEKEAQSDNRTVQTNYSSLFEIWYMRKIINSKKNY